MYWPRYEYGEFSLQALSGESMLCLTSEENQALRIILLRPQVRAQKCGAAHQVNWKKIGITTAHFRADALTEAGMPTARAAAAFRYPLKNNVHYEQIWQRDNQMLSSSGPLSISSFDLFIQFKGVECAVYPVLYPST